MESWILVLLFGELAFIALFTWIVLHFREAKARRLADERLRVLERLGSPREMGDFLHTEAGAKLLALLQTPPPQPMRGVVRMIVAAILLFFAGLACAEIARLGLLDLADTFRMVAIFLKMSGIGAFMAALVAGGLLESTSRRKRRLPKAGEE
jgi:plasmid stabilization system protein ParE